jgi:sulfur carrier protein ThiS
MSDISIKIFRAGSDGTEVSLKEGSTVSDALKKSGLNKKDSEIVQINGDIKSLSDRLSDGDQVVLVKNIEGGSR